MTLPYRDNVGALLFNAAGQVLVARRADLPNAEGAAGGWQLPQGGMDAGEDPAIAIFRELQEEIGTSGQSGIRHSTGAIENCQRQQAGQQQRNANQGIFFHQVTNKTGRPAACPWHLS